MLSALPVIQIIECGKERFYTMFKDSRNFAIIKEHWIPFKSLALLALEPVP